MSEMIKGMGANFVKSCATYEGHEAYLDKVVSSKYFKRPISRGKYLIVLSSIRKRYSLLL